MKESVTSQDIFEEGRNEGREEGRKEANRDTLLMVGTRRFGRPEPGVRERIASITSLERLDAMIEDLLDAAGWEDLLETTEDTTH
jgi:predicted transposase YdaD